jgi:nucleoid DNA-binding protein
MEPKTFLNKFTAGVVRRSGICKATCLAVIPAVFDEMRYLLCEEKYPCIPIESFGTFAVIDIPERERRYTYKGANEIHVLPAVKRLKFAPTKNMQREIEGCHFDPTRHSFTKHPDDRPIRKRKNMRYQPGGHVTIAPVHSRSLPSP